MEISFIIVNYRSEQLLKKCVASIFNKLSGMDHEIIVVNNDSEPLEATHYDGFQNVRIINVLDNKGFAKACNLGAKIAKGRFLFFLNPDTEFGFSDMRGFLKVIIEQDAGIIAPKLVTKSGEIQPWSAGFDIDLLDVLRNNFGHVRSRLLWSKDATSGVDWVSGAAFLISKNLFESIGGFDENFFMYFEDIDLCRRVRNQNKKILRLPQFSVLHVGGQSHRDKVDQKKQYYASQDYYFKKHFGLFQFFIIKLLRSVSLFFQK